VVEERAQVGEIVRSCASRSVWQPGRERPPRDEGGAADRIRGGVAHAPAAP